jgi:hypothetical protein
MDLSVLIPLIVPPVLVFFGMYKLGLVFPKQRTETEIGSIEESIKRSVFFKDAKKNIKILAGELCSKYFNDPVVLENLEIAATNGAKINIAFGPAMHVEDDNIIILAKKYPNIRLFKLDKRRKRHFKLIDEKILSIDEPHEIDAPKRRGFLYEGYEKTDLTSEAEDVFDKLIAEAKEIDKTKFIDEFENSYQKGNEFFGFVKYVKSENVEGKENIRPATPNEINVLRNKVGEIKPLRKKGVE